MMKLNRRQRVAVFFGLAVAVAMGLFPPWEHKRSSSHVRYAAHGYHFIGLKAFKGWLPMTTTSNLPAHNIEESNKRRRESDRKSGWRIDTTTLWVQWLTVAFATAAAVTLLGDWWKRPRSD